MKEYEEKRLGPELESSDPSRPESHWGCHITFLIDFGHNILRGWSPSLTLLKAEGSDPPPIQLLQFPLNDQRTKREEEEKKKKKQQQQLKRESRKRKMGKYCCTQEDESGIKLQGFLVVLVLALVLFSVCMPRPRRRVYLYRCCY
ncbi:hypothetical protein CRG98_020567 [Punica granatum]|uniref:Uncharacterized protein n=1 Tax=Punica granatum TaxID=22663 RepID=A0A2I0JRR9_PUNGR|nr:hypothetical protein CRG98_020567 [Punica granatum]